MDAGRLGKSWSERGLEDNLASDGINGSAWTLQAARGQRFARAGEPEAAHPFGLRWREALHSHGACGRSAGPPAGQVGRDRAWILALRTATKDWIGVPLNYSLDDWAIFGSDRL
ncbi:hypothetical protein VTN77DRAFT_4236 [Rasamsonia byssochlamydoides]|uniref:uncharacterized protein n=1 Tax=Rasamsonia byssochlamydoides TaxID=89139 RepID=UPI0037449215